METDAKCSQCGTPLSAEAPQGLCPKCLMAAGVGSEARTTMSSEPLLTTTPIPEDFAAAFPQLEILELLGRGGMGAVYKARQRKLDRYVALKVLPLEAGRDPHFAERFAREGKALARLNHPNIVAVHDSGQAGEYFYFIMEYVDGTNLRQMMRSGRLSPKEALTIVPKICDALQYAHEEGVVHRDIKPENVLVDKKGRVKIADFGLAKLLGKDRADLSLTASGAFMGTPKYMAPEQIEHPQEVDHRADIYSLGVVFYEMLTGELPLGRFAAPSQKVQLDVRLDEVVLRTLEKEPSMRYQHASQIKDEVENISGLVDKLPPGLRHAMGFEYRSKAALFGLPLVHVAYGTDLRTGKKLIAKGIFAFGDIAKGVVAFGGVAMGGIAFGGCAIGLLALGGFGAGVISLSGLGIALLFSYSGISVAPIAMGGLAAGWYAAGGLVFGKHLAGGSGSTPEGLEFFKHLSFARIMTAWFVVFMAFLITSFIGPLIWWRKKNQASNLGPSKNAGRARAISTLVAIGLVALVTVLVPGIRLLVRRSAVTAPQTVLKTFYGAERPIAPQFVSHGPNRWAAVASDQTLPLFEYPDPGIENCALFYRASLMSQGLQGRAYLEMWCRFPGKGEFFSRGMDSAISGSTDWKSVQTPFFLKAGEKPDLIKLNVVVEGSGTVGVKDVELWTAPLH